MTTKLMPALADFDTGPLGYRNKLTNAAFTVNQRRYVSGSNVGAANTYTYDRWRVTASGQALVLAASTTYPNVNRATAPAGGLSQVVEGLDVEGGTYVLSWVGTATATVNGSAVANGGLVTLPGGVAAVVAFAGGTVERPQLERASVPTGFEFRPFADELGRCQRYCVVWGGDFATQVLGAGFAVAVNSGIIVLPLPARMRAVPVVTVSAVADWALSSATVSAAWASFSQANNSPLCLELAVTGVGSPAWTANGGLVARAANINARLIASAEL
jgi:hypothetical protein